MTERSVNSGNKFSPKQFVDADCEVFLREILELVRTRDFKTS